MGSQTWDLTNAFASGGQVALEFRWTGTLAIALGSLPAGFTMTGRYATILEYRDGKISRQRNYDCFDPF
jgi:hypothetical protein